MIAERVDTTHPVLYQNEPAPLDVLPLVPYQEGYDPLPPEMLPGETLEDTYHDLDDIEYFENKKKLIQLFPNQEVTISADDSTHDPFEVYTYEGMLPVRYAESSVIPGRPKIKNSQYELEFEQLDPETGEVLPSGYVFDGTACSERDFLLSMLVNYNSRGIKVVDFDHLKPYCVDVLDSKVEDIKDLDSGDVQIILEQYWKGNHYQNGIFNNDAWTPEETIGRLEVRWFRDIERVGVRMVPPTKERRVEHNSNKSFDTVQNELKSDKTKYTNILTGHQNRMDQLKRHLKATRQLRRGISFRRSSQKSRIQTHLADAA